ncbi:MAG TPA: hypothetical protein VNN19_02615 [bacterium]|nr:hypothetical protein [bacterium]
MNLVRFKNFRERMKHAHEREAGTLQKTVESFREEAKAHFDLLRHGPARVADLYAVTSARAFGEDALSWASMFERQLEMIPDEAALGREMAFVYLMAILDGFVAGWRVDMGLDAEEERAEAARPDVIRDTCRELGIEFEFPTGFDRTLAEMRARRNVLVHRAGRADATYCRVTGMPELLGRRLDVSEEYLDRADRFVTGLGLDLIARSPRR